MINIYYRSVKEAKAGVIGSFRQGSWIDVCDPSENEIEKITEKIQFFLKLFFAVNERYNFFLHDINKRLRTIKIRLERIDTEDIVHITIPTMIFSFFGMNVNLPYSSHQFSYLAVVCFTLLISLILIVLFIKNRWLR